jgi:hypothetical protein
MRKAESLFNKDEGDERDNSRNAFLSFLSPPSSPPSLFKMFSSEAMNNRMRHFFCRQAEQNSCLESSPQNSGHENHTFFICDLCAL